MKLPIIIKLFYFIIYNKCKILIQDYCLMKWISEFVSLENNLVLLIINKLIQVFIATSPCLLKG